MSTDKGSVKLTVVYDNYSLTDELQAAWGFSCLIENLEQVILFDTGGQGPALMANMAELDIDPGGIDAVVLSHAHWDHMGGLGDFLEANDRVTVHMLDSFPNKVKEVVRRTGARLVDTSAPAQICAGAMTTGEMASGGGPPEQSLVIESESGSLVLTGCAHPGVVSVTERALELASDRILLVAGGYHLHRAGRDEVNEVAASLRDLDVKYIAPCHCSGEGAVELLRTAFGPRCLSCSAGEVIDTARLA